MKMVVPNLTTYFPDGVGAEVMEGVYGTQEWYFSLADKYPLSKIFLDDFGKLYPGFSARWTAHVAYTQIAMWADAVTPPPRRSIRRPSSRRSKPVLR